MIQKVNNKLETNFYIKPSNKQLYLDFQSNHPNHCKEGVIYGQVLRVIERCSNTLDAEKHLENLKNKLEKRNYPEKLIKTKFMKARKHTRRGLIHQSRHEKSGEDEKVRLIFTYNRGNPPLHSWLRGAKKLLVKDERARKLGENIQICYRQPRNLKTHIRKPCAVEENPGCTKCGRCRVSCPVIVEGGKFTSTNTKRSYKIRTSS